MVFGPRSKKKRQTRHHLTCHSITHSLTHSLVVIQQEQKERIVMTIVKVGVHLCGLLCIVCISLFSQQNELWKVINTNAKVSSNTTTARTTSSSSIDRNNHLNQTNNHISAGFTTDSTPTPTPQTTILYSKLRQDQSGWVIFDMLKAHSYTYYQKNMVYGGACGTSVHMNDTKHVLQAIGLQRILQIVPQCPPSNTNTTTSSTAVSIVVKSGSYYEQGSKQRMQSTEWLNYMKQQINHSTTTNTTKGNNTRTITVHIRRGDVTPCCYPDWYMPNKYFQLMIEHFVTGFLKNHDTANTTNNIKVNIYSQSKSFEPFDSFLQMKERLMMGRSNNNKNVTVDVNIDLDGDIGVIWKSILTSDVIIPSRSEFSRVPSMFTNGKVISPWTKDTTSDDDNDTSTVLRQIHHASDIVRTNIFNEQCPESMILRCKHKWWQKKGNRK